MKNGKLMVAPAMLWLSIFFVIPLLIVVAVSFAGRTPYGQIIFEFTTDNYLRFLEPLYLQIFADTLIVAVITTVATIIMGYPLAYFIARLPKKWQQPGLILVMIPFWINFLIRSYAWVIILRTQGVVNTLLMKLGLIDQPLQMLYNDAAVMLGMIYALLPFMVLPIGSSQRPWRIAADGFPQNYAAADDAGHCRRHDSGIHFLARHVRCAGRYGRRQIRAYRQPHSEPVPRRARLAIWFRAVDCAGRDEPCADYPLLQSFTVAGRGQSRCKRRGVAIFC